jgi:hypothetical protein
VLLCGQGEKANLNQSHKEHFPIPQLISIFLFLQSVMSFRVVHKVSDRPLPIWSVSSGRNGLVLTGDSSGQMDIWYSICPLLISPFLLCCTLPFIDLLTLLSRYRKWNEGGGLEKKGSLQEEEDPSGENGGILSIECESMEEDRFYSVSMGGDISLWDVNEGKRIISLRGAPLEAWSTATMAGRSEEKEEKGRRNLITAGANGRIAVFVPESGRIEQVISAGKKHLHCIATVTKHRSIHSFAQFEHQKETSRISSHQRC